mgnify:CR=1 FL=1|jgi:hypothetical protein
MATFEAAGDFEDQIREAVSDQMETIVEQVRDTAEAFVEFPGERSKPVESEKVSDSTWRVSLGNIGVIEEFGGTYSAPKAPLRRACEATGLELS